jgi:pimeloyl-ACP methyl ester carboxylesterase
LLTRSGNAEIQLDLFRDYATNVALYPQFQEYFRTHHPPLLAVGSERPVLPAGRSRGVSADVPNAAVRLLDAGHYALETHAHEIAAMIHEFLGRVVSRRSNRD